MAKVDYGSLAGRRVLFIIFIFSIIFFLTYSLASIFRVMVSEESSAVVKFFIYGIVIIGVILLVGILATISDWFYVVLGGDKK